MAPDFKSYLATQIVAEKQTVSYRNVSRALKVHVNDAKCMLYEFWEKENKKKPESIYATYLIAGTKKTDIGKPLTNGHGNNVDEDEPMPSSPPPFTSSMLDPSQQTEQAEEHEEVPVKTISLVREEDLESTKAQYDSITSIHIYSLTAGRLQDLVALTDIGRGIFADTFVKEDPLTTNKIYGVIQNPAVRRRQGKRPIIPEAPAPKFKPTKDDKPTRQPTTKPLPNSAPTKPEPNETSRPGSRDSSASASSTKQPTLKRDGSSLFKAFAKAGTKPKLERKDTDASTNASASGTEDVKLHDADEEGESEDEALFLDTGTRKPGSRKRASDVKKEREDKQAKLRKMMDSDDEQEAAVPNVEDAAGINEDPPAAKNGDPGDDAADDEDVAWSDSESEKKGQTAGAKDSSTSKTNPTTTEPKRRRGKRKVMKKRTMKDEEGFLVTKEEAVWESFSEDEPEPDPAKNKPRSSGGAFSSMKTQPASSSQKGAKGGGTQQSQQGQKKKGDIMSFFGKK